METTTRQKLNGLVYQARQVKDEAERLSKAGRINEVKAKRREFDKKSSIKRKVCAPAPVLRASMRCTTHPPVCLMNSQSAAHPSPLSTTRTPSDSRQWFSPAGTWASRRPDNRSGVRRRLLDLHSFTRAPRRLPTHTVNAELNAFTIGSDSDGVGYLAPGDIRTDILSRLPAVSELLDLVT